MKLHRPSILILAAVLLLGCGSVSKSVRRAFPPEYKISGALQVSASCFLSGQAMPVGSSFSVYMPKEFESDLEFKEYVGLLSAFLVRSGFKPTSFDKADYSVIFTYGIDNGRTEIESQSLPTYGVIAGGTTTNYSGSIYNYSTGSISNYSGTSTSLPVYGKTGTTTQINSHRVYKRQLELNFADLSASKVKNSLVLNSTIKVLSEGSIGILREVMPLLLDSAVNSIGRSGVYKQTKANVPYFSATEEEAANAMKRVARNEYPDLLIYSAQNGDYLTVKALLNEGISPDTTGGKKGRSVLEWAVTSRNQVVVRELLTRGAAVDVRSINMAKNTKQMDVLGLLQLAQRQHAHPIQTVNGP